MKKILSMRLSFFMLWVLLSVSCTKEPVSNPTAAITQQHNNASVQTITHFIGERFGGGIVFHLTADNHGLIADSVDLPVASWWDGKFKTTGAKGTAIGTGKSNTSKIISTQNILKNFAALECYNSTRGGKTDWFLPSKNELNALFNQRHVVGVSGFFGAGYWSSSETDSAHVWWQSFSLGFQSVGGKNSTTLHVRAIRAF